MNLSKSKWTATSAGGDGWILFWFVFIRLRWLVSEWNYDPSDKNKQTPESSPRMSASWARGNRTCRQRLRNGSRSSAYEQQNWTNSSFSLLLKADSSARWNTKIWRVTWWETGSTRLNTPVQMCLVYLTWPDQTLTSLTNITKDTGWIQMSGLHCTCRLRVLRAVQSAIHQVCKEPQTDFLWTSRESAWLHQTFWS